MNQPCTVSVVIPCFNHGEFLPEAVASVLAAGRPDLEVIVVDDGSTDARTALETDHLVAQRVHVIRQENKGLAAARNTGIAAAHGIYIFPLDADDHLRSGWIDRGIEILNARSGVGVVYGDAQRFGARTGRWRVGPFSLDGLLELNFIHASALYRRTVWEQNHGYDDRIPAEEDWDFWLGALEHGWQFSYLPEVFFEYRQSAESMITRAKANKPEIDSFIAKKHAFLYRRRSIELSKERTSIKASSRNLYQLLKRNLRQRFTNENPK